MSDNTVTREQCRTILRAALPDGNLKRLARAHIELLDKLDAETERCARIAERHAKLCATHALANVARQVAAAIRRGE